MINLLDTATRNELRAARINTVLRRYIVLFIFVIGLIVASFGVGYLLLQNNLAAAKKQSEQAAQDKARYAAAIKQGTEFRTSLGTAKKILDSDTPMSSVLTTIANTLPSGSILTSLTLSQSSLSQPMTFTISTTNIENANNIADSFRKSPYFTKVSLNSASTEAGAGTGSASKYPVTVAFVATLNIEKLLQDQRSAQ